MLELFFSVGIGASRRKFLVEISFCKFFVVETQQLKLQSSLRLQKSVKHMVTLLGSEYLKRPT